MSRTVAWVVLIAASVFAYTLAFTPYDHLTNRYRSTDDRGWERVKIECPPPLSVLISDAQPASVRDHGSCELSSRGKVIEAALVFGAGLLLSFKPVTRARPDQIGPLSDKLNL